MRFPRKLLPVVLIGLVFQVNAEVREWTQAESRVGKIKAEFVKMVNDETVMIRVAGGRTFEIPVKDLSEDDQNFILEKTGGKAKGQENGKERRRHSS